VNKRKIPSHSIQFKLLKQSREAALNAVQTFNNPLTTFKTEAFIVLIVIAWTYLLHAYYRNKRIDYRYYQPKNQRRRYDRTKSGSFKYWELERCLLENACPLDSPTIKNLLFLIGLRHEIEHHQSEGIDDHFSGRYLACCLNYERTITELFGDGHGLGNALTFTLQFRDITKLPTSEKPTSSLQSNVLKYLQEFDSKLPGDDFQSPHYAYRLLFVRKLTSKIGQADRSFEFISAESELAKTIDQEYWVIKDSERKKYRRKDVMRIIHEEGYTDFSFADHTELWKKLDAKNPGKGYGIEVIPGIWLWYDRWLDVIRQNCQKKAKTKGEH
jgi:hypothetical protein